MISPHFRCLFATAFRSVVWLALLFAPAVFAVSAPAAVIDPRLGAPFTLRERPSLGSPSAPIVVIDVSNFQCSHCQDFHQEVFPQLRKRYIDTGKVQWVMLNGSIIPTDKDAAVFAAAHWALRKGRYWQTEDFLFANNQVSAGALVDLLAKKYPADAGEIETCLRPDSSVRREVAADFAEIALLKVPGTPMFYVRRWRPNGKYIQARIYDYESFDYFEDVIARLMAVQ
jgi:protein-disulfide isomerase